MPETPFARDADAARRTVSRLSARGHSVARRIAIVAAYIAVFWILLPAVLLIPDLLGVLSPAALLNARAIRAMGALCAAVGAIVIAAAAVELRRVGRGLPISHLPPVSLVKSGPYCFSRHPVYLGFVLLVGGLGCGVALPGVLIISTPVLIVAVAVYITREERGLEKRYGTAYELYRREVPPLFPSPLLFAAAVARFLCGALFQLRVRGRSWRAAALTRGLGSGFVLLCPHNNYFDPLYLFLALGEPIHFLTTHDMYRTPLSRRLFAALLAIRFDRYRPNPTAVRRLVDIVRAGGIVGVFPEGGRSWYGEGAYSAQLERLLLRRALPVLPVRIDGAYQAYPRWGRPCRHPVTVRIELPRVLGRPGELARLLARLRSSTFDAKHLSPAQDLDTRSRRATRIAADARRIMYVCPSCRRLGSLTAGKRYLACKPCGATVRVDIETGRLRVAKPDDETQGMRSAVFELSFPEYHTFAADRLSKAPTVAAAVDWTIEGGTKASDQVVGAAHLVAHDGGVDVIAVDGTRTRIDITRIDGVMIRAATRLTVYTGRTLHTFGFSVGGISDSPIAFQDYIRLRAFGSTFRRNRWQSMIPVATR